MNRRALLASATSGAVLGGATLADVAGAAAVETTVAEDLARYDRFGIKASGGPGDQAVGAWLERRIAGLGYETERQPFAVPYIDVHASRLEVDGASVAVTPQAPWRTTVKEGMEGRLARWPSRTTDLQGRIAVVDLPYARWSSFSVPEVQRPVRSALAAGAAGVALVTTGPTGEALALNTRLDEPPVSAPVVLLAPNAFGKLASAMEEERPARLTVAGSTGERAAYNLIGRLDRGAGRWLVISTPRSGWFGCAGERGPGIAAWLALAAWARTAPIAANVMLFSASGHEREYAGAKLFMRSGPPPPERTAFWLHLGAGIAARDWQEYGGRLLPLPSADPQRFLVVEPRLVTAARRVFRGQPGLEAPYAVGELAAGELGEILQGGYARAAGVFGAHRFHHAASDDLRCVDAALVQPMVTGFKALITTALAVPNKT